MYCQQLVNSMPDRIKQCIKFCDGTFKKYSEEYKKKQLKQIRWTYNFGQQTLDSFFFEIVLF